MQFGDRQEHFWRSSKAVLAIANALVAVVKVPLVIAKSALGDRQKCFWRSPHVPLRTASCNSEVTPSAFADPKTNIEKQAVGF